MVQQEYDLKLDSYPQHLKDIMNQLLSSEDFTDVTLVCDDGKQIKAHRNILSVCSPVLKNILQIDKRNVPIIYLRGINHYEMEAIIKFIYLGQASVLKTKVDSFLLAADNLKIKELSQDPFSKGMKDTGRSNDDTMETSSTNNSDNSQNSIENDQEEKIREDPIPMNDNEAVKKENQNSTEQSTNDNIEETVDTFNVEEFIADDFVDQIWTAPENPEEQEKSQNIKIKSESKPVVNILDGKTCDECGKVFTKRKNLAYHKVTTHSNIEYPCSKCDFKATRPDRLRIHIQSKHLGTKFSCPHCQKEFNFQTNCIAHIKSVHEKVKYECSYCEMKYTDRATLRKHVLRKHSESKPTI